MRGLCSRHPEVIPNTRMSVLHGAVARAWAQAWVLDLMPTGWMIHSLATSASISGHRHNSAATGPVCSQLVSKTSIPPRGPEHSACKALGAATTFFFSFLSSCCRPNTATQR